MAQETLIYPESCTAHTYGLDRQHLYSGERFTPTGWKALLDFMMRWTQLKPDLCIYTVSGMGD